MSNFTLAYDNQADGATLSTGSWAAALPLDNLKSYRRTPARSTDATAASTKFRFALAEPMHVGALALAFTNASVDATYRWRLFSDAGFTDVIYDSGTLDLYPAGTIPQGQIPWGAPNWWTAKPREAEIERFQRNIIHVLSTATYARYGDFQLTDTANADGYFEAARLMVAQAFAPSRNASYGASLALKSRTKVDRDDDGARHFHVKRPDFSIPFTFDWLDADEAMRALDLQATVDLHGEVVFLWDHEDVAYRFRKSVFGQLAELNPITHPMFATHQVAFQVEGVL